MTIWALNLTVGGSRSLPAAGGGGSQIAAVGVLGYAWPSIWQMAPLEVGWARQTASCVESRQPFILTLSGHCPDDLTFLHDI